MIATIRKHSSQQQKVVATMTSKVAYMNYNNDYYHSEDAVAERLRRSTRNRLGLSRVGSSPAGVVPLGLELLFLFAF